MKIMKAGKALEVKAICPYCKAVLLVSRKDAESVEIGSGWTRPSIDCPSCGLAFFMEWEDFERGE